VLGSFGLKQNILRIAHSPGSVSRGGSIDKYTPYPGFVPVDGNLQHLQGHQKNDFTLLDEKHTHSEAEITWTFRLLGSLQT